MIHIKNNLIENENKASSQLETFGKYSLSRSRFRLMDRLSEESPAHFANPFSALTVMPGGPRRN